MNKTIEQIATVKTGAIYFASGSLTRYDIRRKLGSFSVNTQLIRNIDDYINNKVPNILQPGYGSKYFSDYITLLITGAADIELIRPLRKYTRPLFKNDTEAVTIEFGYKDAAWSSVSQAIAIIVRFSATSGDSYLSIAVQDTGAKAKALAIEDGLLAVLDSAKNQNWISYPNELIPTLVFVAGFLIGLTALMVTNPVLKSLCIVIFGIAVYLVACRFSKGYCSFESTRQQRLNIFLKWFTAALAISILVLLLIQI